MLFASLLVGHVTTVESGEVVVKAAAYFEIKRVTGGMEQDGRPWKGSRSPEAYANMVREQSWNA